MPIKPENKSLYPAQWTAISRHIRKLAGDCCEFCGVKNHKWIMRHKVTSEWVYSGDFIWLSPEIKAQYKDSVEIVLTVAHMDHNPANCDDSNLKALCQRCHLTYDAQHHAANAAETRKQKRDDAVKSSGQLSMFADEPQKKVNYD